MHLSISKRFEFSASHRLIAGGFSDEENVRFYGLEGASRFGHGHNFVAAFVFNGPVEKKTGMMINVTTIKERLKGVIDSRYDHKYLNTDTPPFDHVVPTPENISAGLLGEAAPMFGDLKAVPIVCHLEESPTSEATAYTDGRVERHLWTDFSSARRTYSPHVTDGENETIFGTAARPSGHGHHYRLRVTLGGSVDRRTGVIFPEAEGRKMLHDLRSIYDHRNLSLDIPEFRKMPNTTETLARIIYDRLSAHLPVLRVKLYENDNFFVEYSGGDTMAVSVLSQFHAAHRLHSCDLSDNENASVYGICNNPLGHGHLYRTEMTIEGTWDERTGMVARLDHLNGTLESALSDWNYKHLNMETDQFRILPTTGENITRVLFEKLQVNLEHPLKRVRLWETPNNRFTLRRSVND